MHILKRYTVIFCLTFTAGLMFGQSKSANDVSTTSVFFIGEEEKNYEKLVQNYNTMLFTVCSNNMELAFENWSVLLKDIEDYSTKSNVDLKGIKLWLNVFWAKDGSIDHIVFYPKPNSKNLNYDNIKLLFANFIKTYQSPLKHSTRFSHYGSASFPVFSKTLTGTEK